MIKVALGDDDGDKIRFKGFTVENMVGQCDFKFPIRLESVAAENRGNAQYDPENFAGLVWRFHEPKLSILVFVTGKVVVTGARNENDIRKGCEQLYPTMAKHQK